MMVLVSHAAGMAGPIDAHRPFDVRSLAGTSGSGVYLFFVLSGYLISGPFLNALARGRRLPMLAGYAVRRAARILPAYWIPLVAIVLVAPPWAACAGGSCRCTAHCSKTGCPVRPELCSSSAGVV